jgi:hypothetical protein
MDEGQSDAPQDVLGSFTASHSRFRTPGHLSLYCAIEETDILEEFGLRHVVV